MRAFFVADLHLGHANICPYAGRPFIGEGDLLEPYSGGGRPRWASRRASNECSERMSAALIRNIQSRMKEDDILYHLGDFCCKGPERGVPGSNTRAAAWEGLIDRRIVHIVGNHDRNNSVKHALDMATMTIAGKVVLLRHRPPSPEFPLPDIPLDYMLCGHVHEKWQTMWYEGVWVYNVGVDVNKFMPVRLDEVVTMYERRGKA